MSAQQAVQDARRDFLAEQERCPHWDYEGEAGDHPCCHRLAAAEERLHKARVAARAAERGAP